MKPKREITLGEMQDECKRHGYVYSNGSRISECAKCNPELYDICHAMASENGELLSPAYWNLTDPPRFTEAQMALLKALWDIGARFLACDSLDTGAFSERPYFDAETAEWLIDESDNSNVWIFSNGVFGLKEMEVLDLAELFGKEGK